MLQNLTNNIIRHLACLEGGEVTRLLSYISTIPVSELNRSFTHLRKETDFRIIMRTH